MKHFISITILFVSVSFVFRANSQAGEAGSVLIPPVTINFPSITVPLGSEASAPRYNFEDVRTQVFEVSCYRCHGVRVSPSFQTYSEVQSYLVKIESLVRTNQMPPKRPLDDGLKAILFAWIQQGSPEN